LIQARYKNANLFLPPFASFLTNISTNWISEQCNQA